ncbi:MAG: hypothetical protein ACTHOG_08555 [Marmoricola sp.]
MTELFAWEGGVLTRRKVVQCALSRVCGACGRPLGRPIVFLGTPEESAREEFHLPPLHADCVARVSAVAPPDWEVVRTAGFEFVRPTRDDRDQAPRFVPNSRLD